MNRRTLLKAAVAAPIARPAPAMTTIRLRHGETLAQALARAPSAGPLRIVIQPWFLNGITFGPY
jgi:hypothetical protein